MSTGQVVIDNSITTENFNDLEYYPKNWYDIETGVGLNKNGERVLFLTFWVYPVRYNHSENKAIYGQYIGERLIAYEVIKIRKRPKRYNTILKRIEPDKEVYPSKGEWGDWGWSPSKWKDAIKMYNKLK